MHARARPDMTMPAMYCKKCNYDLRHLTSRRCPECGRPFDPDDPSTYLPTIGVPIWIRACFFLLTLCLPLTALAWWVVLTDQHWMDQPVEPIAIGSAAAFFFLCIGERLCRADAVRPLCVLNVILVLVNIAWMTLARILY